MPPTLVKNLARSFDGAQGAQGAFTRTSRERKRGSMSAFDDGAAAFAAGDFEGALAAWSSLVAELADDHAKFVCRAGPGPRRPRRPARAHAT